MLRSPADILAVLLRSDPARPRVTYYDDVPGPTVGERIELSGKVLANWVAKAANLLQDEFDIAAGDTVGLGLPADHWRSMYWVLAAWSVGASVDLDGDGDVLITDDAARANRSEVPVVWVSLAALSRSASDLPAGALDEAADLSSQPDVFGPIAQWPAGQSAIADASGELSVTELSSAAQGLRVFVQGEPLEVFRTVLSTWAADGSVVLCRGADRAAIGTRLAAEGVRSGP